MNVYYEKMVAEDYDNEVNFGGFIEICDKLLLPVFEVHVVINPFAEPHRTTEPKMYKNMSEFRRSMPDWSARAYDYENDRILWYRDFEGIADGDFKVNDSNNSTSYQWHFQVMDGCVVVHTVKGYLD